MDNTKCINCREYKRCKENRMAGIFFIIGLIATIAIRVVTLLIHVNPLYGQIAWYIGVIGFLLFFVYKYNIDSTRYKIIKKNGLMVKILGNEELKNEDKQVLSAILCALSSSKDRINYFVIFASSALALIAGVYFDFIK
ncbi:MAG: hypothetical protein PHP89_06145 [Candidatus Omnitrophica bacterium]|nr:hypothetical protein [Candidatus Omnitrophota bacterium]MDD3988069.1 hypothetical protein [Candidatus Omnitrophota bacterium]